MATGAATGSGSTTAISVPTLTVCPSGTAISVTTPDSGEGTSLLTLSVITSTRGSYFSTRSPWRFSQRATVPSTTLSPSLGMVTLTMPKV
jgi:hypothetical protein